MPKCEHGLTSKECYVCASPKHAEQAEKQEPFGYFQYAMHFDAWVQNRDSNKGVAFYTTPPQRKPLTDEQICRLKAQIKGTLDVQFVVFARAIEAAHGIKENT